MFLELHYAFRYNRLTDQTECALFAEPCMSLTQHELKYQPVDNRLLNSISLSAMKAGVECWDRDVKSYLDSSDIVAYHPFTDDLERLHVRRAYKQHGEPLPRIANFIATSNRRNLLTDMTGSRRFICVEVEHFIDSHTPIEYEQLYAQLKKELQRGERSWFSKEEEAVIQERNRAYYRVTPGQELLEGVFTLAQPGEEGAYLLSAVQIYTQLKQKNPSALCDCSPTAFSRLLAQVGTRVHTRYGNGYWVKPKS